MHGFLDIGKNLSRLLIPKVFSTLLCHDLTDLSILPLLALVPMPPWSSAGYQTGFDRYDGILAVFVLAYCYLLQIPIVFQQVSAFMEHSHFPLIKQLLRWLGLSSRLAEAIDAPARAPVSRRRILNSSLLRSFT